MLRISEYKIIPFLPEGAAIQNTKSNNGTDWLRDAINYIYNRNKGRIRKSGVITDLLHNHNEANGQTIVRYPLIQYQRRESEYFVVGINEGADCLRELFTEIKPIVNLYDDLFITIELHSEKNISFAIADKKYEYSLTRWLPLSRDNYKKYSAIRTLTSKLELLELILTNHITKDLFVFFKPDIPENEIQIKITGIDSFCNNCIPVVVNRHTHDFQPFSISFTTNLFLPENICVGNGKSFGFGLIKPVK